MLPDNYRESPTASSLALPLEYVTVPMAPTRHSFFSCLSLVMAVVANAWLMYVMSCFGSGPPHWQAISSNPLGVALYETHPVPGVISVILAIMGILHRGRKRTLSYYALALDGLVYLLLTPPMNFA